MKIIIFNNIKLNKIFIKKKIKKEKEIDSVWKKIN
jgi:hypothetical protein